jgi:trans-aconitate 2-methyltransferase
MTGTAPRDWDASSYHRVALPHLDWARAVLDRLDLRGEETVLDAGCGSGRVTELLIERLPRGRVIAVDASPSMVAKVREALRPGDEGRVADLTELGLESAVDAVFSTAVFHWIADHELLFDRLRAALRPEGRLAAQCGGEGNVRSLREVGAEVAALDPFAGHLGDFSAPWNYAGPRETEERLRAAGFEEIRCWLEPWPVTPPEPFEFLRTVCLGAQLDLLPPELRDPFVAAVLERLPQPTRLDYVRLNIEATAGGRAA